MIRFAVALLALVAVCLSPGCSKEEENNGQISLALNWKPEPQFGGFYAAQQAGAFTSRGLTVDILPGGSGTPTIQMVGAGKVDYAIVGISGIDDDGSLLDFDYQEVRVSQAIIDNARQVLLAADSSKFGRNAVVRLGSIALVDRVFTDSAPSAAIIRLLHSHKVQLDLV